MFAGLMSRWMMPAACRYCRPSAICNKARDGVASVKAGHVAVVLLRMQTSHSPAAQSWCGCVGCCCEQVRSLSHRCPLPAAGSPTLCPQGCACPPAGAACRHTRRQSGVRSAMAGRESRWPQRKASASTSKQQPTSGCERHNQQGNRAASSSTAAAAQCVSRRSCSFNSHNMAKQPPTAARTAAAAAEHAHVGEKLDPAAKLTRPALPARRWAPPP